MRRASRREKVETLRQRTATIEISRREGPLSNQRSPTGLDEDHFMCLGPHNGNMVARAFDLIMGFEDVCEVYQKKVLGFIFCLFLLNIN